MQVVNFDLWGMLLSVFFFLTTCSSSTPVQVSSPNLTLPDNGKETRIDYSNVPDKLTLILLGDSIYAFEGSDITKGKVVANEGIRTTILAAKRKYASSSFVVIIKPSARAIYQNTVDLLDEMTINKIERYSLEELSPEEKQLLKTDNQSKY